MESSDTDWLTWLSLGMFWQWWRHCWSLCFNFNANQLHQILSMHLALTAYWMDSTLFSIFCILILHVLVSYHINTIFPEVMFIPFTRVYGGSFIFGLGILNWSLLQGFIMVYLYTLYNVHRYIFKKCEEGLPKGGVCCQPSNNFFWMIRRISKLLCHLC